MLIAAFLLQVAVPDSAYSSPALRDFVASAAVANRAPPPALQGYTARLGSELALILRDSLGREELGQVEQLAAQATWTRDGRYDVHVIGLRSQMGIVFSALSFTRMYTVPTLYGNRLAIGLNDGLPRTAKDSADRVKRMARDSAAGRPPARAVHPLAVDREKYYRFRGGDTVAILSSHGRTIRLVRVYADPIEDPGFNYFAFRGELDFDADRHQLVRMRGRFEEHTTRKEPLLVRTSGTTAVAYVEFENAEVGGKYWLPSTQRSEFQVQTGLMTGSRPVYRIVTRFREHALDERALTADVDSISLPPMRATLSFATNDSVSNFSDWERGLGALTASVHTDDFDDLAPDSWRPTGDPRVTFWPRDLGDIVHYNRIEGLFTGVSPSVDFRDAAPGLSARGVIGAGWSERSPRGYALVSLKRGQWTNTLRGERTLASTNDFYGAFDSDYVDRYSASWMTSRLIRDIDRGFVAGEIAYVADRYAPFTTSVPLDEEEHRFNRLIAEGHYARGRAILELNPRVSGQTMSLGYGARVRYEVASGELDWQRVDVRLAARHYWHGLLFSTRLDAGAVTGRVIPPQAIYEIGGGLVLPSYEYKEFGGDRAAVGRALAAYYIPVLRKPIRLFRGIVVPGLSPGVGVGIQGGWTEAATDAARTALLALGGDGVTPLSRPTDGIRSTIDLRMTFLSGAIGFGLARPLDQAGEWRWFLGTTF